MLLVNLRMDATYIKEGMNIAWVSEVRTVEIFTAYLTIVSAICQAVQCIVLVDGTQKKLEFQLQIALWTSSSQKLCPRVVACMS